jgi:hypothetical protein
MIKFILSSLLFLSSFSVKAQAFEGQLSFQLNNTETKEVGTVEMYMNGVQSRMDFQLTNEYGASQYSIYLDKTTAAASLVTSGTYYDIAAQLSKHNFNTVIFAARTSKTAPFLGQACEEIRLSTDKGQWIVWVTNQLSVQAQDLPEVLIQGIGTALSNWGIQGVPVKMVFQDKAGVVLNTIELTQVASSPQTGASLSLPTGLKKAN